MKKSILLQVFLITTITAFSQLREKPTESSDTYMADFFEDMAQLTKDLDDLEIEENYDVFDTIYLGLLDRIDAIDLELSHWELNIEDFDLSILEFNELLLDLPDLPDLSGLDFDGKKYQEELESYKRIQQDLKKSIAVHDNIWRKSETFSENRKAILFWALPQDEQMNVYDRVPPEIRDEKDLSEKHWEKMLSYADPGYQKVLTGRSIASSYDEKDYPRSFVQALPEKTALENLKANLGRIIRDEIEGLFNPIRLPGILDKVLLESAEVGDQEVTIDETLHRKLQLEDYLLEKHRKEKRRLEYAALKAAQEWKKQYVETQKADQRLIDTKTDRDYPNGYDPRNSKEANDSFRDLVDRIKELQDSKENFRAPAIATD